MSQRREINLLRSPEYSSAQTKGKRAKRNAVFNWLDRMKASSPGAEYSEALSQAVEVMAVCHDCVHAKELLSQLLQLGSYDALTLSYLAGLFYQFCGDTGTSLQLLDHAEALTAQKLSDAEQLGLRRSIQHLRLAIYVSQDADAELVQHAGLTIHFQVTAGRVEHEFLLQAIRALKARGQLAWYYRAPLTALWSDLARLKRFEGQDTTELMQEIEEIIDVLPERPKPGVAE
jgi:hypothetical protein